MNAQPTSRLEDVRYLLRNSHYNIERFFAFGGSSELWLARDRRSNELVVVKCLIPSAQNEKNLVAFAREARLLKVLRHPGVVELRSSCDIVQSGIGFPYHVLEHVIGRPVNEIVKIAPIRGTEVIDIAMSLARALAYLGTQGIVHRDIKPANIVWDSSRAVILDFGIAIEYEIVQSADDYRPVCLIPSFKRKRREADDTATGIVNGTAGFMAPEVILGAPADHRSDLFSLGATLYYAVSGYKAFQGDSDIEAATRTVQDAIPYFSSTNSQLDHVIRQLLAKDPGERFQSAEELLYVLSTLYRT